MKVQEVKLSNNRRRHILLDDVGCPVPIVIKYLDNSRKSANTLKTYCYALKLYFQYLEEIDICYTKVNLSILSNFVAWLRNPYGNSKAISIKPVKAQRTEKTVNLIITYFNQLLQTSVLQY